MATTANTNPHNTTAIVQPTAARLPVGALFSSSTVSSFSLVVSSDATETASSAEIISSTTTASSIPPSTDTIGSLSGNLRSFTGFQFKPSTSNGLNITEAPSANRYPSPSNTA